MQALNYAKNDELFKDFTPTLGDEKVNRGVVRGRSAIDKNYVKNITKDFEWYGSLTKGEQRIKLRSDDLATQVNNANGRVINDLSKSRQADERANEIKRMVNEGEFLDPEDSAREYGMLGERQRRIALRNTWGYLTRGHFSLNQNQAINPGEPTKTLNLGSIMVGRQKVADVVKDIREILNDIKIRQNNTK